MKLPLIVFALFLFLLYPANLFSATYGLGGAMEEPTLSLTDASTGSAAYTNSATINVSVGNDTAVSYWLISETQTTQPSAGDSGWSAAEPTTYTFNSATNGTKTVYIWIKDASSNINTGPASDTIYMDNTGPAGSKSISFSGITTTGMTITGAELTDAGQGDEYYEFDCTTSDTFDKARTKDTRSYALSGMSPNTQYTFKYRASDGLKELGEANSNYSDYSSTYSKYTLAGAPSSLSLTTASSSSITCAWSGDAAQYQVQYSANSDFSNASSSDWQTAKTYTISSLNPSAAYYVKVKGKNGDGVETSYSSSANTATSAAGVTTSTTTTEEEAAAEEETAPTEEAAPPVTAAPPAEPAFIETEQKIDIPTSEEKQKQEGKKIEPPQEPEAPPEKTTQEQTTQEPPQPSEEGKKLIEAPSEMRGTASKQPQAPKAGGIPIQASEGIEEKTIVTVIEGRVFVFNIKKAGIAGKDIINREYLITSIIETIEPSKIYNILINDTAKLAYLSPEISAKLENVESVIGIPVLVTFFSRPEFKTEFDIVWTGTAVVEGEVYETEEVSLLSENKKAEFRKTAEELKRISAKNREQTAGELLISEVKAAAPKDIGRLLEEEKAKPITGVKLVIEEHKSLLILIAGLILALIAAFIILRKN